MLEKESFIFTLKDFLISKNMTIEELAKAIGIERHTVSRWFGSRSPRLDTLVKIANYFECSIDYLIGRTEIKTMYSCLKPSSFFARYCILKDRHTPRLTDYQISKQCTIRTSTIVKWKDGVIPEFEILVRLCNVFGCSFDYLVGRAD